MHKDINSEGTNRIHSSIIDHDAYCRDDDVDKQLHTAYKINEKRSQETWVGQICFSCLHLQL